MSNKTIDHVVQSTESNPDHDLANDMAKNFNSSCKFFTTSTMLNPSSDYEYANNPGIHICSSPIVKANSAVPVPSCISPFNHSRCMIYSPEFSVMKKVSVNFMAEQFIVYLSRFKSFSGSYFYLIYNDQRSVYNRLTYEDVKMVDLNLDSEAIQVFNLFVAQFEDVKEIPIDLPNNQPVKNSSFISTILS